MANSNQRAQLRRSPHGECGLKSEYICTPAPVPGSLPAWGVWIEISSPFPHRQKHKSLPAWGVWIEINCFFLLCEMCEVAPRMGSVD